MEHSSFSVKYWNRTQFKMTGTPVITMHPTRSQRIVKNQQWKQTQFKMKVTTVTNMHPTPNLLKIYDARKENIKEWAVLDLGAASHFLVVDVTASKVIPTYNPITFTIQIAQRSSQHMYAHSTFHNYLGQQELAESSKD